jgi:hypothetical protein
VTVYRKKFRDDLVQRMQSKNASSQREIALETGVAQPTLSRWLRQATLRAVTDEKKPRRKERTPSEKLQIVLETAGLPEAELGACLRERGIFESELIEASRQVGSASTSTRGARAASSTATRRRCASASSATATTATPGSRARSCRQA